MSRFNDGEWYVKSDSPIGPEYGSRARVTYFTLYYQGDKVCELNVHFSKESKCFYYSQDPIWEEKFFDKLKELEEIKKKDAKRREQSGKDGEDNYNNYTSASVGDGYIRNDQESKVSNDIQNQINVLKSNPLHGKWDYEWMKCSESACNEVRHAVPEAFDGLGQINSDPEIYKNYINRIR